MGRSQIHQIIFFFLAAAKGWGFVIGNPGAPALETTSVLLPTSTQFSFRVAYLDDYVYSQHFTNEFHLTPVNEKPPMSTLATNAAQVTFNLFERIDLYGIIGSAQLQMDEEVYTQRELAWGMGAKWVLYTLRKFRVGIDVKYFETSQKPMFLVSSGLPLDLSTNLVLNYSEWQGAIGFSYESDWLCPYIVGTYLSSTIDPKPPVFLVYVPGYADLMDASIHSMIGKSCWGAAVGATLLMGSKGTLAIESRFINQNAINASLELRF